MSEALTVADAALDYAAELIGAALGGVEVSRDAIAEEPADDEATDTGLVVALATGTWTETGYCMGAARPYEFEHAAPFEVLVVGGDEAARKARLVGAVRDAAAAIAADTTLGGRVDHAEFVTPDPSEEALFAGLRAILQLTFTAPDALG